MQKYKIKIFFFSLSLVSYTVLVLVSHISHGHKYLLQDIKSCLIIVQCLSSTVIFVIGHIKVKNYKPSKICTNHY